MKTERQKQINQRLIELSTCPIISDFATRIGFRSYKAGFKDGAEWADANPDPNTVAAAYKCGKNETIEKACEWLRDVMYFDKYGLTHKKTTMEEFINDFRKAMEP